MQGFSETGAADTKTIFNAEQGAVHGALNVFPRHIEKLIGQPFQGYAQMGATVAVQVKLPVAVYHKQLLIVVFEAFTGPFGDLGSRT